MTCLVCGLPGLPLKSERADFSPGSACSPTCATLVFLLPTDKTPYERQVTAWRFRQRRAEVRGEDFTEPMPMDEAEREMAVRLEVLAARGIVWDKNLSQFVERENHGN